MDTSPSKIQDIQRPENILKNEVYLMMLKEPLQNSMSLNESSGILTYSKNQDS